MSFPQSWLNDPPEIPEEGSLPNNQMRQYASTLRRLVKEGSATEVQIEYLFAYEQRFTPEHLRTVFLDVSPTPTPDAASAAAGAAATPAESVVREFTAFMKEMSSSLRELRMGYNEGMRQVASFSEKTLEKMDTNYAGALDKLNEGIEKLNAGQTQLNAGYAQLTDDHRSLLGHLFPHVSQMYTVANESMAVYRQGLIDTSKAEVRAAQATASTENGLDAEVSKALGGLLTDAARIKLGLAPSSDAARAAAAEEPPKGT